MEGAESMENCELSLSLSLSLSLPLSRSLLAGPAAPRDAQRLTLLGKSEPTLARSHRAR